MNNLPRASLAMALACGVVVACAPGPAGHRSAAPATLAPTAPTSTSTTRSSTGTTTSTTAPAPTAQPPSIPQPIRSPGWVARPGDGDWQAAGRPAGGAPALYTTLLHNAASGPPVAVAWFDTSRLRFALYAGTSQPTGMWSLQGAVGAGLQPSLVATFNSGFQLAASRGGWYADGRTAVALRPGAATAVIYRDGSATVGAWGRDLNMTSEVVAARQNLGLLVDAGAPVAGLDSNILATWGITLGHVVFTARSALGVDAAGHVLYAAGPALSPSSLAAAMVAAGAVRAMELDINPEFVNFDFFSSGFGGLAATKLLPGMYFGATHFLTSFWRDFFAVFTK